MSWRPLLSYVLLLSPIAAAAAAAQSVASTQPAAATATERFRDTFKLSREEVDRYVKSGAPPGAENDPRLRWAARFWDLRGEYSAYPAGGDAARESVRLLFDAGRVDEALARIDSLPRNDAAWRQGLLGVLREAAVRKSDRAIFLPRIAALLAGAEDAEFRARLHYSAGRFHLMNQDRAEARAAFEAAIVASPESDFGKRSSREIHDLRALNVGQPAPAFSTTSLAGKRVSNESLTGHATVFVYWASWCRICTGEVPQLKELHAKYSGRGVVFLGIPGDEELQPVRDAVARLAIPWDQLFDARGPEAPLWTEFNVEEQPSFYVFDREGRIVAKRAKVEQLAEILGELPR